MLVSAFLSGVVIVMAKVNKQKVGLGVGLGLAAAAAAGAGYFFYGSPSATKNRKKVAKWASDIKTDVVKKAKKLEKFDEAAYHKIVDESVKAYKALKKVDPEDVAMLAKELKENWDNVSSEFARVAKKKTSVAKKAVATAKKAVKAAPKKAVKAPAKKAPAKKAKK
jgi:glutamate synthase domain-containing protein 3